MRWLVHVPNSMGMNLSKLQKIAEDPEAWCAAIYGVAKSQTCLRDRTTTAIIHWSTRVGRANEPRWHVQALSPHVL